MWYFPGLFPADVTSVSAPGPNGDYSYVPNKSYSGPDKPALSSWVNTAYTTDTYSMPDFFFAIVLIGLLRSSAIEVLAQDYITVARAKGLPQRLVLSRHVLRNAVLPVVTMVGLSFPNIIAGAVIAEEIFNYPGMGLLMYQASTSHDFPILIGDAVRDTLDVRLRRR